VLFSHAFLLTRPMTASGASTGRDPLEVLDGGRFSLGSLAVDVFFVLSGYLVAQSWLSDRRPGPYLARRALRIGPGLVATVVVTALVAGPLFVHRDVVPMRWWITAALMLLWIATWHTALLNVTAVLGFSYTAVHLATRPPFARGRLTPRADISYGVYLYGFLAEQIAVAALGARANPWTGLLLAVPRPG
jgi:peptidoglycan/LPS O-acetylase OafA/YrhL